jgi:D-glycero-D-manno-heptose 1,7-bisphosphate phosphatase
VSAQPGRAAVFVDKDGTLVEDVPYNVDPVRIRLAEGAYEALSAFAGRGLAVIVVSNQPGVALGRFAEEALSGVKAKLQASLKIDAFYYCPHHPEAGCECRKPNPGLLLRAAREQGIDLGRSWMIGDILNDVEAGRRAGCRTCLIDNGNETEWHLSAARRPDNRVGGLAEAASLICGAT